MASEHVSAIASNYVLEFKLQGEILEASVATLQTFVGIGLAQVGGTIDGATIGGTTPCPAQVYRPVNAQTGTTYTLALSDNGKLVTLSNASAVTLTVPTNASVPFPIGAEIDIAQLGAGTVGISAAGGVTVNAISGDAHLSGQYAWGKLRKTGTNTWLLIGGLTT